MTAMAQLLQNCYAYSGAFAGGSRFAGLRVRVHSLIQTTADLAESSIPATIPSKFKIKSLQTATPQRLDSTLSL